ncbi:hypothetical protein CEXT_454131 [Caerostris extrusa]|uniref:Uncharacterized protein n=1 Tax=Caerostris extrusa TaxID=172846 RepID=A0AAV4P2Z2_CAEEX|nr:hypothetical protein CEXT_454131 [Caerostris extrusa]
MRISYGNPLYAPVPPEYLSVQLSPDMRSVGQSIVWKLAGISIKGSHFEIDGLNFSSVLTRIWFARALKVLLRRIKPNASASPENPFLSNIKQLAAQAPAGLLMYSRNSGPLCDLPGGALGRFLFCLLMDYNARESSCY